MKGLYDLHVHSCLSPCGDEEMTPNNIVGMAQVLELQILAVSDHNTARQLPAVETTGTHHKHREVGNTVGNRGVGDYAYRHTVGNHEIVALAQLGKQLVEPAVHKQLGWIRRRMARRYHVEIVGMLYDVVNSD